MANSNPKKPITEYEILRYFGIAIAIAGLIISLILLFSKLSGK